MALSPLAAVGASEAMRRCLARRVLRRTPRRPSTMTETRSTRSVVVALFPAEPQAAVAVTALRERGVDDQRLSVLRPGDAPTNLAPASSAARGTLAAEATHADVSDVLKAMGIPDGEARFYAEEAAAGRTLVVVDA